MELQYLHEVFYDLYDSEGIKWSEVYYYQKVKGIILDSWELAVIKAATTKCAVWYRDQTQPKPNSKKGKVGSKPKSPPRRPPRRR